MLNVTWERKDLSFNNQGFLSNPSMVIVALDRERLWDKVAQEVAKLRICFSMILKCIVFVEKVQMEIYRKYFYHLTSYVSNLRFNK